MAPARYRVRRVRLIAALMAVMVAALLVISVAVARTAAVEESVTAAEEAPATPTEDTIDTVYIKIPPLDGKTPEEVAFSMTDEEIRATGTNRYHIIELLRLEERQAACVEGDTDPVCTGTWGIQ